MDCSNVELVYAIGNVVVAVIVMVGIFAVLYMMVRK